MTTLMQASRQWSSRPDDQRFTSLPDLMSVVSQQHELSTQSVVSSRKLIAEPHPADPAKGLVITQNGDIVSEPTNWSFGQLAQLAGAPAGYLRKLPAPLAADAINYGMRFLRDAEDVGVLRTDTSHDVGYSELRAATGPRYGRIWNADIVSALMNKFGDGVSGQFRVPGEFGKAVQVNKSNTTIFGSDRDIFIFLADEERRVEVPNRRDGKPGSLARGFFVWNSEVGSQSIGAAFFLFDYVCQNRIVWGAREFKEIRLRHTVSAPDRWLEQVAPVLTEYANSSTDSIETTLAAAREKKLGDDLDDFLAKRFSRSDASQIKQAHVREEGRPIESLWDVTTAITAHAKSITHQDNRVHMERAAGKVLDLVAS